MGDFEKLKKVFVVDLINQIGKFLRNDEYAADLLSEFLVKNEKLKYQLRSLMTFNNQENLEPVIEQVIYLLNAGSLGKGVYQYQRREKRTWSPSPTSYNKSNTTYSSPNETIGGLKVPKTKKIMTRRSSTSMNRELDERLKNLPSPVEQKGRFLKNNIGEYTAPFSAQGYKQAPTQA